MKHLLLCCLFLSPLARAEEALRDALQDYFEFAEYTQDILTFDQLEALPPDSVQLVDTRSAALYQQEHLPGAINIDWRQILERRDELPKGKPLVFYCNTGVLSARAHFALSLTGMDNIKVLQGGYQAWKRRQPTP